MERKIVLSRYVKAMREANHLTTAAAAKKFNVTRAYIELLEKGVWDNPSPRGACKFCIVFGISKTYFLENFSYSNPKMDEMMNRIVTANKQLKGYQEFCESQKVPAENVLDLIMIDKLMEVADEYADLWNSYERTGDKELVQNMKKYRSFMADIVMEMFGYHGELKTVDGKRVILMEKSGKDDGYADSN